MLGGRQFWSFSKREWQFLAASWGHGGLLGGTGVCPFGQCSTQSHQRGRPQPRFLGPKRNSARASQCPSDPFEGGPPSDVGQAKPLGGVLSNASQATGGALPEPQLLPLSSQLPHPSAVNLYCLWICFKADKCVIIKQYQFMEMCCGEIKFTLSTRKQHILFPISSADVNGFCQQKLFSLHIVRIPNVLKFLYFHRVLPITWC